MDNSPLISIVRGRPDVLAGLLSTVGDVDAPVPFEWIVDGPNAPGFGLSLGSGWVVLNQAVDRLALLN